MKDGIINVYKPSGMTSNDVIYKVRAALGIKKLGHTGTLDPMAEGVLPILINRGTRITEYLDWDLKTYETVMKLGIRTDSLDVTGNVETEEDASGISEEDVRRAFGKLMGKDGREAKEPLSGILDQIPPLTSAVRINGRRLYEYVHDNEEITDEIREKIRPRRIWVKSLEITGIDLPEISFRITCSKGTYIRSITRDVGEILGCGAVMTALKRTESGAFNLDNAVYLHQLAEPALRAGRISFMDEEKTKIKRNVPFGEDIPEDLEKYVLRVDFPLTHFGEAMVSPENARRFLDGWHLGYGEVRIAKYPDEESWISEVTEEAAEYDRREHEINSGSHAGIKLHPEYTKSYRIYTGDKSGEKIFVGIARHSDKYHKLVPDKVFLRIEK
ncbi:MAG: tRNA pseudouridine(55) synthase TruB [Firmicutes bacterium]|nr:tRNA pseudouridine(55) synthase TruB [Bacillota bacterium]